jgi:hypothetical protein
MSPKKLDAHSVQNEVGGAISVRSSEGEPGNFPSTL